MTDLEVVCYTAFDGWNCQVKVADDGGTRTEHSVSVTREEREKYGGASDVHLLVNASFRFLLSNEPKESILRSFALSDIQRYFPDYPKWVAGRLGGASKVNE